MAGDDKPMRPEATQVVGPPRLLAGKYRIGELVGEGGMGSVYVAEHIGLEANVAVKLLNETCIADPDSLARFRREAKAMGAVRHDNVVAVMDTGTDEDGVPFIVMELLEGETLGAILRRNRTVAASSATRIANQILAGLSAAHAKGIVHRDLKPGNVFMARQPDSSVRAKILDFGISKLISTSALSVTADGVAVGTPTYMAPEQVRGEVNLDRRVDIYAVGVILYRMLTGKLPFVGASADELSDKILEGKPRPPSQLAPAINQQLEQAIVRAMSVDPNERYATADELREALALATRAQLGANGDNLAEMLRGVDIPKVAGLEAPTVAASPHARRETAAKPTRSRSRRWAIAAGIAGVTAIVAAGFVVRGAAGPSGPPLRFGVTQFLPTSELEPRFRDFLAYLSKRLDRPATLRIAADADELRAWLAASDVELAALSPFPYVDARREMPDLRLLATTVTRGGRDGYFGSILVRRDGDIGTLSDLVGKPFCFVRRGSSSGWLLPRRELRNAGIDPDTAFPSVHYGQDHLGTLKLLAKGACAGAAVYTKLWHDADEHQLDPAAFRSVADYLMPHDAYVSPGSVADEDAESIASALLGLSPGSKRATAVLRELDQGGFVPANEDAYRAIADAIAAEPSLE